MGKKRTWSGQYICICIASLIYLSGCAALEEMRARGEAREALLRGQNLLAQGDYEGSLKENQKVLSLSVSQPLEDRAIFNMGLIYAHNENPQKDYQKALSFFRTLIKDHPQSPLIAQAKIWVGVLEEDERLNHVVGKMGRENEKLIQENQKLIQENQKSSQVIEKLKQVIKKSSQVDIEIEEKKREKGR